MPKRYFLIIFAFLLIKTVQSQGTYETGIESWKKERLAELKSERGWLNLAGLFWLQEGRQFFGGGVADHIRFPIPSFPAQVGYFERKGNVVKQLLLKDIDIKTTGVYKKEAIVFNADSVNQPLLSFGSYRWTFIQREDRIGIRFRNLTHPAIEALTTIPCFPVDTLYRVKAKLIRTLLPTKIPIQNVLGQTTMQVSPGKLVFTLHGQSFSLDALLEDNKLFIVFGDLTSGKTTYPAGRFLYATMPGDDGETILDFNQSFNPPCAFTPYATCPLPPRENVLPVSIMAGEMKAGKY